VAINKRRNGYMVDWYEAGRRFHKMFDRYVEAQDFANTRRRTRRLLPVMGRDHVAIGGRTVIARAANHLFSQHFSTTPYPLMQLSGDEIDRSRLPCVYIWTRADTVLYVGRGLHGIRRPIDDNHHQLKPREIRPDDVLTVFSCSSEAAAIEAETQLIGILRPRLNRGVVSTNLDTTETPERGTSGKVLEFIRENGHANQ
jgi:hypothetical protein